MNKKFTKLMAALALLTMITLPGKVWADDVTVTLTSGQIKAGTGSTSYGNCSATDGDGNTWNAYAIKNQHSGATSDYHFWQIKKYASNTAYYVRVPELGTKITSITMTVSNTSKPMGDGGNTATLYFSNSNSTSSTGTGVASGTGASSVTIDCSSLNLNTGYITANGAVRIWEVSVTYTAGSLDDSDLAITGAPVALSFDLYNNASAQTVSYTTSSTGEVTITPATSNYFTYEHNATAKTITVTPTAVTPSAQTITISQAADDTYKAGEVSFTVEVANSTPTTNVTINNSGITNTDVYVGTAAGSLSAMVTYDNGGTPAAVPDATVTWSGDNDAVATIASDGTVTLVGAGTVNFTASYAGASGQYLPSSATYEMIVTSSAPYVQPTTIEANLNDNFFGTNYGGSAAGITDNNPVSGTLDNVTITYAGSGNHYINASQIRFYPNNKLTFEAPEGYEITQIVFTAVSGGTWAATISADNGTYTSNTKTWTGSAASVLFTGSGSSRCDMSKATITLAQLAPKHTLTITMSHVADYTIFIDDETVSGPDPENPSQTVQVTEGTTVGVSIGGMEDCYLYSSLTVNGLTTGVSQDDPDDLYFEFTMPEEDAEIDVTTTAATPFTLTVVGMDNVSFDMYMGYNSTEVTITDGTASICEQMHVTIANLTANSGLLVQSVTVTDGTGQPITVNQEGSAYVFNMPSSNATLTFTTAEPATYSLVQSQSQLMPGMHYIIVGSRTVSSSTHHYAMGSQANNNRTAVEVTIVNNTITAAAGIHEFVISGPEVSGENNLYTIYDEGYLYAAGSKSGNSNNYYLRTQAENDANGQWTIAIGAASNIATITAQGTNTNKYLRKNSSSDVFSCYAAADAQNDIYLYVKNEDKDLELYSPTTLSSTNTITVPANGTLTVKTNGSLTSDNASYLTIMDGAQLFTTDANIKATVQKAITAYTSDNDGWNLIASPIAGNDQTISGLIPSETTTTYDLYFLEEENTMWRNYKQNQQGTNTNAGFDIEHTIGYLYANSVGTTINFAGTLASGTSADVTLTKDGDGWNLIGNPLPFNASVNKNYYVIEGRTVTATTGGTVAPCTGIIVQATTSSETVTFSKPTSVGSANHGNIQMVLAQTVTTRGGSNAQTLDNAIVSFNEGSQLGKFYFGTQNANLYIPQGIEEYAIVNTEAQGEMPVNFRANEDGQYTLTVNPENVDMNYLHLIDNMTGMDVDLLQTPSYTFEANVNDYESRFRLVFAGASEGSTTDESFAFFSNGSLIINNEGNATLQVIDITGRILSSESVNGSVSTTLNTTPGVYMLRLINGDNVKVQKIVVR